MEQLLNNILTQFKNNANEIEAIKMQNYMKGHFAFYGIKAPIRKQIVKPISAQLKGTTWQNIHALAHLLWQQPMRECQYSALDITIQYARKMSPIALEDYHAWLSTKSWWDTVDTIASNLVGRLATEHPKQSYDTLYQWIASENMWLNRTAIIHQLKFKDFVNTDFLTHSIVPHLKNKEFFLQKAIGWSLRQYAVYNPQWVIAFLEAYQIKGLALREATKHMR